MTVPWTLRLVEIIDGPEATVRSNRKPDFGAALRAGGGGRVPARDVDDAGRARGAVHDPVAVSVATTQGKQDLLDAVRRLLAGPELAGRDRFPMPHLTRVRRATH